MSDAPPPPDSSADPGTDAALQRFVDAQDDGATHERALAELRAGRKASHWMWFVLPQVAGLGTSAMARRYAVADLDEARRYLAHPVLGPRLLSCVEALRALPGHDPVAVMGGIDAQKLHSSMTLFARAAADEGAARPFLAVLDQYFGGAQDPATLERI